MTYVVYLLCDVSARARCRHYIGIARASRFARRMREHVQGSASKTTARMLQQGAVLAVGATWSTDDASLERTLKNRGHYERLCRRCRGELPLELPEMPAQTKQAGGDAPAWSPING